MTENQSVPATTPPESGDSGGFDLNRIVVISVSVLVGTFLLLLILATLGAVFSTAGFGTVVQIIRDIMLILLALEGALIVLALAILIAQVARLVNLLQNEVGPVLQNTQETVEHVKGTAQFVGKNVSQPLVNTASFVAGAGAFMSEIVRINRNIKPSSQPDDEQT